ncbi:MAG: hypothetical protein K2K64_02780 [Muribaculaceae bacterium]|nr:hypothetical protein [Muribaculaceae bacterium]
MKPRSIHSLLVAALAFAGISLMSACSDDKSPSPEPDNSPTFLSFNISLDKSDISTRADDDDWGDDYNPSDEGYTFDNIVDQMTFRPVIYKVKTDGTIEKFVEVIPLSLLDPGQEPNSDKLNFAFTGMLPEQDDTKYSALAGKTDTYRMMIFTNGYTPTEGSIDGSLTFSQIGNQGKPGFTAVPMWGVGEFSFKDLRKGEALRIGEIPLLRAMAMVRVKLAPEEDFNGSYGAPWAAVDLVSLSINRYNESGMMAPQLWDKLSLTKQEDHKFILTKRIPDAVSVNENGYTIKWATDSDNTNVRMATDAQDGAEVYYNVESLHRGNGYFYLPEILNNIESPLKLTIGYTVHGGETRYTEVDFRPLTQKEDPTSVIDPGELASGNYLWNVVRNHIYEYTIKGVRDSKLSLEVSVKDWSYHKISSDIEED